MILGTPYKQNATKVLLLGSGELGKELTISLVRLGVEVTAVDSYEHAPAMQVAQKHSVIDMTNPVELENLIAKTGPDLIVPEVEAIATEVLLGAEKSGTTVVPSAKAVKLTMDREGIRRLAAESLDCPTTKYAFASSLEELKEASKEIGFPCFIKPVMSSSGKGQSRCSSKEEIEQAWLKAENEARAGKGRVIIERGVEFESEITLLTVRSGGQTYFCAPVGHKQKNGDYIESWQPHSMTETQLEKAKTIADRVTTALGGNGIFGVELFLMKDGDVYFNEVSPRPHDTGMVTMASQKLSQFDLHARAILGLPIPDSQHPSPSASVAIKAEAALEVPSYEGTAEAMKNGADIRIFGKPHSKAGRRMGVILTSSSDVEGALTLGRASRKLVKI